MNHGHLPRRPPEVPARLHGAWRLTAYEDRDSISDDWMQTYGAAPLGLVIYDPTGCLSVQVCEADGSRFDAYFGRYTVLEVSEDDAALVGVVSHEVVASSMPDMTAADPTRPFRITGATLMLGDGLTWRRILERAC